MRRLLPILLLSVSSLAAQAQPAWIATSNGYTQKLLDIQAKYSPEEASAQGLAKYDDKIGDPSFAAEAARRKEEEAVVARLVKATETEKDPNVVQDLNILIHAEQLSFRRQDYERDHQVQYLNATTIIYNGLKPLLDDQTPPGRRRAANDRLKRYVGIDPDPGGNKIREQPNMGRNAAASTGLANADLQDSSLVSALQSGTTSAISTATNAVSTALNYVSQQRVFYGNAESQLNSQETYLQQETVSLASQQNSLVGVDEAAAATNLNQAETDNSAIASSSLKRCTVMRKRRNFRKASRMALSRDAWLATSTCASGPSSAR